MLLLLTDPLFQRFEQKLGYTVQNIFRFLSGKYKCSITFLHCYFCQPQGDISRAGKIVLLNHAKKKFYFHINGEKLQPFILSIIIFQKEDSEDTIKLIYLNELDLAALIHSITISKHYFQFTIGI